MNCLQRLSLAGIMMGLTWVGAHEIVSAQAQPDPTTQAQPAPPAPATAGPMTRAEVAERLNIVPVFAIVSQDGTPVLANVPREGTTYQVANFWLDQAQADQAIEHIRQTNPDVAAQSQVLPISLGYAYEIAETEKENNSDVIFQVLPRPSDLDSALKIVQASGQGEMTEFPGVPLFYGVSEQGILTVERDGVEVVPFFFAESDLQTTLSRASGNNPDIVQSTQIEVTTLAQVVESMLDPNAESDVYKIAFVPSKESLEYVQSLDPNVLNLQPEGFNPSAAPQPSQ